MGCSSCSNGGTPKGCKNNGSCGVTGCGKMDVFDWLAGMELPMGQKPFNIAEVRFKNDRKSFYRYTSEINLSIGDVVAVESSPGYDVGIVSLTGELVRIQMRKKNVKDNHEIRKVLRKANEADIQKWQEARSMEWDTMISARTISKDLGLEMKISDVEYQGDRAKATFYYTAEGRVDFRELIKRLADRFRIRVEMRQIGMRQEAGKLGGIGSCGRELCCASWLTDFRTVSTSSARYQQLALNPQKLAGQCGKLKCCLNYELDQYMEAIKEFPSANTRIDTVKGRAFHFKTDIFKRIMYFIYDKQVGGSPVPVNVDDVHELLAMNKRGETPEDLESFAEVPELVEEVIDYSNVVGQDSLTRFDQVGRSKKGRNKRSKNNRQGNQRGGNRDKRQASGQASDQGGSRPPKGKSRGGNNRPGKPGNDRKGGSNEQRQQAPNDQRQRAPKSEGGPKQNGPKNRSNRRKNNNNSKPSNSSPE
ncbi:MAG: hypothetical protein KDC12_04485 [Flavobacteriales bacterium]|nr:hypothetical protein [Flavobacteriales bacterium]